MTQAVIKKRPAKWRALFIQQSDNLHIPPIFPTYVIQRMTDLP